MGKLLIEMEGITQTIDLLPYILEDAVGMDMMSASAAEVSPAEFLQDPSASSLTRGRRMSGVQVLAWALS